jgi:hypothetical protein
MSKDRINKRLEKIFADLQAGNENDLASNLAADTNSFYWEADQNGLYVICDENIHKGLGLVPQELFGNPLLTCRVPEEDQQKLRESIETGNFPIELTTHLIDVENQPRAVRFFVFQKFDTEGNSSGLRGIQKFSNQQAKWKIQPRNLQAKGYPESPARKKEAVPKN